VAFGAYLCLATHFVGVLHVLVVRHATCPSHGEIIHGGAASANARLAATAAPVAPGASVRAAAPESGEDLDEHCLFVATRRREMAGLAPARGAVLRTAPISAVDAPPSIAAVTVRTIFRLAPKTSPPIAAG